jgi:hypothetical protein
LLKLLAGLARDRTGLPVLRCYWYEMAEGRRTAEHDALAEMPGLKLRLVNARPGRREGIDSQLRRDLVTLAKSGAISDAFIAGADEHLAEIVAEVQDLGLRVVILHIASDGGWTIPQPLRQECDDIVEISGVHLRPFVELIRGAEPAMSSEQYASASYGSRPADSVPAGGALTHHGLPAAALPAPGASYPVPPDADYRPAMQPYNGAGLVQSSSSAAYLAPGGPGQPAGQADASSHARSQGPAATGHANHPGMQPPQGAAYQNAAGYGAVMGNGPGHSGPVHGATQAGQALSGGPQNGYQGSAAQNGAPPSAAAYHQGVPQNGGQVSYQNGGLPPGVAPNGQGQNGYQGGLPAGQVVNGAPQAAYQNGSAQPGYQNGSAQPGYQNGSAQPGYQNGSAQVGYQGGPGRNGAPQGGPGMNGAPQGGPGMNGAPQGAFQGPAGQNGLPQGGFQGPAVSNGSPVASYQAADQRAGSQPSSLATFDPAQPNGLAMPYGAPDAGFLAGQVAPGGDQQARAAYPPGQGQPAGGAYAPQAQYAGQPQQPAQQALSRPPQPIAISLPEAVKAAHSEGFSFGESVGRDAPGLWLEAVLARKPRMPSDLEARLLQGSVLPIDSLLHDEVRHSLRRGFWDALESARR